MDSFITFSGYSVVAIGGIGFLAVVAVLVACLLDIVYTKWKHNKKRKFIEHSPQEWYFKILDYERKEPTIGRERATVKVIEDVIEQTTLKYK